MEEQQLSFKDKYITPLTKEYKDFIHEMENTPSEIFYRDGERRFTEQERKFMQIYEQKQPKISAHYMMARQENPITGLLTNEVAGKSLADKNYLYLFDEGTKNTIEAYLKTQPNLEPIELTSKDYLAISNVLEKEKNLGIELSSEKREKIVSLYYELYQAKEKQELKQTQNLQNMEAITPQEKVKEIFNEIQEKFNPKEKAFLEVKMIEFIGSKHNLGMAEVGNHLTSEEIQNVNQYLSKLEEKYFNPIEDEDFGLVDENYNKLLSKVVYTMETNNAFMNDVNPIFLEVAQNIQKRKEQFNIIEHLNNQMKYLGFGDNHKEEIQKGIDSNDKSFQIKTTSDRVMEGNQVDFAVNFNKSEKGGVFLNSFDARLITQDGEERSHNFKLNFTAKEAINLLEGRAVKTEFTNSKTNEPFESFVRLKFNEPKNEYNNYKLEFHKANEIDTAKIVELSGLKFEKPEYKDFVIKSLEKGNITNVKFTHEGNEIEGKAVLNPQYKNLNLYDKEMNRLNTNKPLQGLEQDNSHEKNNVRQQNISRSI